MQMQWIKNRNMKTPTSSSNRCNEMDIDETFYDGLEKHYNASAVQSHFYSKKQKNILVQLQ
jgi:hypothetical protein